MFDSAQEVLCPECGAEIQSLAEGRDLALPVSIKPAENGARTIFTAGAPCPFCATANAIPEWARALRPARRDARRWHFAYRGIL